jgi:uncharacterized membrane protein YkvA (DUF1232 family)
MTKEISPLDPQKKEEASGFIKAISEPLSKYGWPVWLVYLMAAIGLIYLLNPTAGIFEFIPDNIPFIGNLDEGVAVMLILAGIVEAIEGKKYRKEKKNQPEATTPPKEEE